jgi:hypothetical protein
MARSARRRHGGKQKAQGKQERANGTEKATEVMTAVRLLITAGELIWVIARDNWPGDPGRLL